MSDSIRPLEAPADYPALARLLTRINPDPSTPESLAEADQRTPEGTVRLRLVAQSARGELVGYGAARRFPYEREGQFTLGVQVAPDHRGRGTGSALLAAAERFAREQGAARFRALVRDDDPTSLTYAQKRGFVQERHCFWSTLDVNAFDEGLCVSAVAALEAGGIRFASLADEPGEATERALYELDRQASADNPGEELPDFLPFAEWRRQVMGRKESRQDLVLFARHGQRLVGTPAMGPCWRSTASWAMFRHRGCSSWCVTRSKRVPLTGNPRPSIEDGRGFSFGLNRPSAGAHSGSPPPAGSGSGPPARTWACPRPGRWRCDRAG